MKNLKHLFVIFIIIGYGCEYEITKPLDLQNKNLLNKIYSSANENSYYYVSMILRIYNDEIVRRTKYEYDDNYG